MRYIKRNFVVVLFFFSVFLLGLSVYKDYGVSWDEMFSRSTGLISWKYVINKIVPGKVDNITIFKDEPGFDKFINKRHGPVFDMFTVAVEIIFKFKSIRNVYLMRHLCNFLVFFLGLIFLFKILKNRFDDWKIAVLGCMMMLLSPRFFAESFYNPKDIIFLSFFIIAIYFLIKFIEKPNIGNSVIFSLVTAIAIDTRITGIIIPATTIAVYFYVKYFKKENKLKMHSFVPLLTYFITLLIFIVGFFPYMWDSPLKKIIFIYKSMSHIHFCAQVLFNGKLYASSTDLPWFYLPFSMLITIPLFYILCFFTGIIFFFKKIVKDKIKEEKYWQDYLFMFLFFVPLLIVIIQKSNVYDSWRHMYFIYGPFIIISVSGIYYFLNLCKGKVKIFYIAIIAVLIMLTGNAIKMYRYHPFEYTYFNCIAGRNIQQRFEVDYWGVSYLNALEYVFKNDRRDSVKIWFNGHSHNKELLNSFDRKRIRWFVYDTSEFKMKEFSDQIQIKNLCGRIKQDCYNWNYTFRSKENTIEWLNEIIRNYKFPDIWLKNSKDKKIQLTREMKILFEATGDYRKYQLECAQGYFSPPNERLNRLLLEITYAETPKSSISAPDYFLSEYKWHIGEYNIDNEYYSISNDRSKFMVAYKIH
ncbi:MAG: glycosyltransferase family 39 protein [Bacteroidales bacterium]|nr:glycosyltransferase family 39 protein [Bacteroidales bacterium]